MPDYVVVLSKKAEKQLDKLNDKITEPIFNAIDKLTHDPRPNGCKKLKGREAYRIRIGDYRVIYEILDRQLIIDIVTVGDRKDVYE